MRETQHTTIDEIHYACTPLDGWEGVRLFFELVSLLGESALMMITRAFAEGDIEEADAGEIVGAGAYSFFSKLDSDKGMKIMQIVMADCYAVRGKGDAQEKIDLGTPHQFNLHFKGETLSALKVFVWAMQVNYQSFLEGSRLTGILGRLQAAMTKQEPETAESPETTEKSPPPSSQPSPSTPTEAVI